MLPPAGISVGWNWGYDTVSTGYNTIAFNNISDIGQGMLSDMGCIYTLGPQVGTVVNNNVCSKVYSFNYGGWGLYTGTSHPTFIILPSHIRLVAPRKIALSSRAHMHDVPGSYIASGQDRSLATQSYP